MWPDTNSRFKIFRTKVIFRDDKLDSIKWSEIKKLIKIMEDPDNLQEIIDEFWRLYPDWKIPEYIKEQ